MSYGLVGLYALFFIFVGINGNAAQLFQEISKDAKGFSAWVIAILILKALSESKALNPMVKPFIALAILTFVVRNYSSITSQVNEITGLKLPEGK
jgi:hypothetical protein